MRRNNSTSITIADVAEKAGVSTATVSRYINSSGPVSEHVADRIEVVMSDLKYVPNAAARQLASQKTNVLGLLINNIHNDFFGPLLMGIESSVRIAGYNLLVGISQSDQADPAITQIGPQNTDGLLIFADALEDEDLIRLKGQNFPMVLIHRSPPEGVSIPSVTVENKSATFEIVSHLIKTHNRRNILFFRGPVNQEDSTWREIGYKSALEANGIEYDPRLILEGGFERDVAFAAMEVFLANDDHPAFDAIFAGDDDAAIGVLNALHNHSIQVPQQVSVVGFDDSRLSAFLYPSLTTIRAPTKDVGQQAVNKLIQILNNEDVEFLTLLPSEIIVRNSCGCHNSTAGSNLYNNGGDAN